MNELLIVKRHSECFEAFETYINNIKKYKNVQEGEKLQFILKEFLMRSSEKKIQLISYSQFRLAFMSLLCLNTRDSFNKMKNIIATNLFESNNFLKDKILVSCFLLAYLQVKEINEKRRK